LLVDVDDGQDEAGERESEQQHKERGLGGEKAEIAAKRTSAAGHENLLPMGDRRLTKPLHWLQMGRVGRWWSCERRFTGKWTVGGVDTLD
jgi:hypothetical protein